MMFDDGTACGAYLDVAVHDALGVRVVQRLEQLQDVVPGEEGKGGWGS